MSRLLRLILATLAIAAVAAACSGAAAGPSVASLADPEASGSPTPSASALTPQDAALAYARCMRENGIDMPDPIVSDDGEGRVSISQGARPAGNISKDDFLEAEEECRHFMDAAMPDAGPPLSAEDMDKMLAFAQCMREHGIAMEDPTADGGIRVRINDGSSGGKGMPENDDEMQAAHEACGDLLPGKFGKPGVNSEGGADGGTKVDVPDPAGSN